MPLTRSSTCAICGKYFENQASIKRHERYCRSRLTHPPPPRRRCCLACINAKSRCDSRKPACGHCQRRGRKCVYASESSFSMEAQPVSSPTRSSLEQRVSNIPEPVPISQSPFLDVSLCDTDEAPTLGIPSGSSTLLSSDPGNLKSSEYVAATRVPFRTPSTSAVESHLEISRPSATCLLQPKERRPAEVAHVSKLVSQIISSFPERMIKEASYPPFIHQSTFVRSINAIHSADDPIFICQVISRKFALRKARGDFSVWDAIAIEQERIYEQRASLDKRLHLSSAQAITVYLLMLVADGDSVLAHHPNLPITLLFTLRANFDKLHQTLPGYVSAKERSGGRPVWEDWVFAESKLRTATVYFILALHFNVDFGLPCNREIDSLFEDVELPAAKTLWEAKTELSWEKEFDLIVPNRDSVVTVRTFEARLKYGDLVKLSGQDCGYEKPDICKPAARLADRIKKWHKEMDEFGMLVALCSTMV